MISTLIFFTHHSTHHKASNQNRSYKVEKRYDISVDIQLIFMILGTLIGSRVGHVIFYEPHILNRGILEMFYFWKGGLASHGAVIGILIAMALYSYKLEFNKFKLTTIKNVMKDGKNIGYLAITENANDIKAAIDERKTFVIRTAIAVGIVILIFSFVLNRYFLKPIKNLVSYTKIIKNKDTKKTNIDTLKLRNDELGLLSNSLDDMTLELQKRISHAENFSTDLVHEIRNPLASLKSASEILYDAQDTEQRLKLINILSHDVPVSYTH